MQASHPFMSERIVFISAYIYFYLRLDSVGTLILVSLGLGFGYFCKKTIHGEENNNI